MRKIKFQGQIITLTTIGIITLFSLQGCVLPSKVGNESDPRDIMNIIDSVQKAVNESNASSTTKGWVGLITGIVSMLGSGYVLFRTYKKSEPDPIIVGSRMSTAPIIAERM